MFGVLGLSCETPGGPEAGERSGLQKCTMNCGGCWCGHYCRLWPIFSVFMFWPNFQNPKSPNPKDTFRPEPKPYRPKPKTRGEGARPFGAHPSGLLFSRFGLHPFWRCWCCCGYGCCWFGISWTTLRQTTLSQPPPLDRPKFHSFFPSPATISIISSLSWACRGIVSAVQGRIPHKKHVWASLGSFCVSPGGLRCRRTQGMFGKF